MTEMLQRKKNRAQMVLLRTELYVLLRNAPCYIGAHRIKNAHNFCVVFYWQTANEGRPRPEEIIGNAKTNTKEKWHTYTQIKQYKQKTCQTVRSY